MKEFIGRLEILTRENENKGKHIDKLRKEKEEYKKKYASLKRENKTLSTTMKKNEEEFKAKLDRTFDEVKEMRNETMFTMKNKIKKHEDLIDELREENQRLKELVRGYNQAAFSKNDSGAIGLNNHRRGSNGGHRSMDFRIKSYNDISGISKMNNINDCLEKQQRILSWSHPSTPSF